MMMQAREGIDWLRNRNVLWAVVASGILITVGLGSLLFFQDSPEKAPNGLQSSASGSIAATSVVNTPVLSGPSLLSGTENTHTSGAALTDTGNSTAPSTGANSVPASSGNPGVGSSRTSQGLPPPCCEITKETLPHEGVPPGIQPGTAGLPVSQGTLSADGLPPKNLPSAAGLPSAGALPNAGGLPRASVASASNLPNAQGLPSAGSLPGAGALPSAGGLPGAGALPSAPNAVSTNDNLPNAPGVPNPGAVPLPSTTDLFPSPTRDLLSGSFITPSYAKPTGVNCGFDATTTGTSTNGTSVVQGVRIPCENYRLYLGDGKSYLEKIKGWPANVINRGLNNPVPAGPDIGLDISRTLVSLLWAIYLKSCEIALSLIVFITNATWLQYIHAALQPAGEFATNLVYNLGGAAVPLGFTVILGVVMIIRGQTFRAVHSYMSAIVIVGIYYAFVQDTNIVDTIFGEDGWVSKTLLFGRRIIGGLMDFYGNNGGSSSPGYELDSNNLVKVFIAYPAQMINFGSTLPAGCQNDYLNALNTRDYDSVLKSVQNCQGVNGQALVDYAENADSWAVATAIIVIATGVGYLYFSCLIALEILKATAGLGYYSVRVIGQFAIAAIPEWPRNSLYRVIAEMFMRFVRLLYVNIFMGIFIFMMINFVASPQIQNNKVMYPVTLVCIVVIARSVYHTVFMRLDDAVWDLTMLLAWRPGRPDPVWIIPGPSRMPARDKFPHMLNAPLNPFRSAIMPGMVRNTAGRLGGPDWRDPSWPKRALVSDQHR